MSVLCKNVLLFLQFYKGTSNIMHRENHRRDGRDMDLFIKDCFIDPQLFGSLARQYLSYKTSWKNFTSSPWMFPKMQRSDVVIKMKKEQSMKKKTTARD